MAVLGSTRLKVANGSASVERLWNGRYRLEFLCDPASDKTDWYHENIGGILPEFLASQDDFFGDGVDEAWQAIPESVYPNMVCVEAAYVYIPSINAKRVSLAYETLTSSWVQEKDDTIDYDLNGLKRVSRTSVALPNTAYTGVVGTTTLDSDGTTVYLGTYKIDETDAKWTLTEVWLEAGVLRESTSGVGDGLVKKSITYLKTEPAAPADHVVTSRDIGDFEGLQTITVGYMVLPNDGLGENVYSYKTTDQFTVPGIVDYATFTDAINTFHYVLDITPPIPTSIDVDVEVRYTSDGTTAIGAYYQPNYWTKVTISGSTLYNKAFAKTSYHINHIAGSTGVIVDTTTTAEIDAIQGNRLYQNTTGRIEIDGPSADIAGTDVILNITRDNVFTSIDGVNYYKLTTVTGTIPARPSAP